MYIHVLQNFVSLIPYLLAEKKSIITGTVEGVSE